MRKVYRYKDITYKVADETELHFTVEVESNGGSVLTLVNVPGNLDPEIHNSDSTFIGNGTDLREGTTICTSDVINPISRAEEDEIRIIFKINGNIIETHSNPKEEEENPKIVLYLKFPEL